MEKTPSPLNKLPMTSDYGAILVWESLNSMSIQLLESPVSKASLQLIDASLEQIDLHTWPGAFHCKSAVAY
jgi:hypothetical protein